MPQLALSGVSVEFGATRLLANVTFGVERRQRWGIVGRNGSGKTTLFNLITGAMMPTRGQVIRESGLRITVLDQHRDFEKARTVWEAAAGPFADLLALERSLAEQGTALAHDASPAALARYDRDFERFEREGGYSIAPRVDAVLHGLGFDPEISRERLIDTLSGGERGRLGLARQLVSPAEVLLLDEPTNHLDLETTAWLEEYLGGIDATILLISHDRAFLQQVVDHVLHVEERTTTSYACGYEEFVRQRTERRLSQQRAYDKQRGAIASEEDFIRRNIAGGNSKQAKGRRRRLERVSRLSPPPGEGAVMSLRLDANERGGDQVIVADRATIKIEERTLIQNFSVRVERGEVVSLIGPNGAGKSTLIRTLLGEREPEAGELRLGSAVAVAYYRQDLAQVPIDRTIYEIIDDLRPQWNRGQVQGHLGRFGFSGDTVLRKGGTLSGGERARVALAMLMLSGANLLIFDEPTNHLDVESIEALEDAIDSYDGTVLLVSHDRALLRALSTRMWVLHGTHITDFDGGFSEWETVSAERAHAATVTAAEEESKRRVQEKQRTRRSSSGAKDDQPAKKSARKKLEDAESLVGSLETRISALTTELENPELYTSPDGGKKAATMGRELEVLRKELDQAFEHWARAQAEADR
ncbi:MAG: ABC-F family ATP-binding cassette domain-containing protein [Gemmatimonadota bacterium]